LYAPIKAKKALLSSAIEVMKKKPMLTTAQVAKQALAQASEADGAHDDEATLANFIDSHLLAWLMVGSLFGPIETLFLPLLHVPLLPTRRSTGVVDGRIPFFCYSGAPFLSIRKLATYVDTHLLAWLMVGFPFWLNRDTFPPIVTLATLIDLHLLAWFRVGIPF
jgi:hypothetical protein